jgi:hypothetical protein
VDQQWCVVAVVVAAAAAALVEAVAAVVAEGTLRVEMTARVAVECHPAVHVAVVVTAEREITVVGDAKVDEVQIMN